jgi:hypothetical protein
MRFDCEIILRAQPNPPLSCLRCGTAFRQTALMQKRFSISYVASHGSFPGIHLPEQAKQAQTPATMDVTTNSRGRRAGGAPRPPSQRSAITNGKLLPGVVDQRSAWVRRCKDLIAEHSSDVPNASVAEASLIRRACVLTVELEMLEAKFASDGQASSDDLDLYARATGHLRRCLETISSNTLRRRPKDANEIDADDPAFAIFQRRLNRDDDAEAGSEIE